MLEVFDELGIRPHRISGTSLGAVIGALYASGMTAAAIRGWAGELLHADTRRKGPALRAMLRWIEFKDLEFGSKGIFRGGRFMMRVQEAVGVTRFDELKIPLRIVATDFWRSEQVVLESGDLLPAIRASMSLPGLFTPVRLQGRILIDGAGVNPVPHDVLTDCEVVVALDLMGRTDPDRREKPNLIRSIVGIFDIMQNAIIEAKRKASPPRIYIRPEIYDVDILDFDKVAQVLRQAAPACDELRRQLKTVLAAERPFLSACQRHPGNGITPT
jgi:NTE family protein